MNRFEWSDGVLGSDESFVLGQDGIGLYDGEEKTAFQDGGIHLTTHRLIWKDPRDPTCRLSLSLGLVKEPKVQQARFTSSEKLLLNLNSVGGSHAGRGPVSHSPNNHIKLAFRRAGLREFHQALVEVLKVKCWQLASSGSTVEPMRGPKPRAVGIVGIERSMAARHKHTDQNISQAFEDLDQLMNKAKDMVKLSDSISQKLRDRKGSLTDDETAQFKGYLLSMGIADPVTRVSAGHKFSTQLAHQLATFLQAPLKEHGGIMTLADVYCRVNRARGMELLSPEDLVGGVREMEKLGLPVRLCVYQSGVMVVKLASQNDEAELKSTMELIDTRSSLTPAELARAVSVSTILAKERLMLAEQRGLLARDDSIQGLRFFPNWFNTKPAIGNP